MKLLEEIMEKLDKQLSIYENKELINTIIKIYWGYYSDYNEYRNEVNTYNEMVRKENETRMFSNELSFMYTPEKPLINEELFYIAQTFKMPSELKSDSIRVLLANEDMYILSDFNKESWSIIDNCLFYKNENKGKIKKWLTTTDSVKKGMK